MGRRNWTCVDYETEGGDLVFDIRVEREQGLGGYCWVRPVDFALMLDWWRDGLVSVTDTTKRD